MKKNKGLFGGVLEFGGNMISAQFKLMGEGRGHGTIHY